MNGQRGDRPDPHARAILACVLGLASLQVAAPAAGAVFVTHCEGEDLLCRPWNEGALLVHDLLYQRPSTDDILDSWTNHLEESVEPVLDDARDRSGSAQRRPDVDAPPVEIEPVNAPTVAVGAPPLSLGSMDAPSAPSAAVLFSSAPNELGFSGRSLITAMHESDSRGADAAGRALAGDLAAAPEQTAGRQPAASGTTPIVPQTGRLYQGGAVDSGANDLAGALFSGAVTALACAAILGAVPQLHRLVPTDKLLAHPLRSRIYALASEPGGVSTADAARRLGIAPTTAAYHLQLLQSHGFVATERIGNRLLFYRNGDGLGADRRKAAALLRNAASRRILHAIAHTPGGSLRELAERAGLTLSGTYWAIHRLEHGGLLSTRRSPKSIRYEVSPIALEEAGLGAVTPVEAAPPRESPLEASSPSVG